MDNQTSGLELEAELREFLENRNLVGDVCDKLERDKIDMKLIVQMTDAELATYFTAYGDRLALKQFCRRKISAAPTMKEKYKTLLKEQVKRKSTDGNTPEHEKQKRQSTRGTHAHIRSERQIEFGWLVSTGGGRLTQVRKGTGTKKIMFAKTAKKNELLEKGKELFFPNGLSAKGHISKFSLNIVSSKQVPIEENVTVEELYQQQTPGRLRLYLSSRERVSTTSAISTGNEIILPEQNTSSAADDLNSNKTLDTSGSTIMMLAQEISTHAREENIENIDISNFEQVITTNEETPQGTQMPCMDITNFNDVITVDKGTDDTNKNVIVVTSEGALYEIETNTTTEDEKMLQELENPNQDQQPPEKSSPKCDLGDSDVEEDSHLRYENLPATIVFSDPPVPHRIEYIEIDRKHIVDEILQLYDSANIQEKLLKVTFKGEMGVDCGGLLKELFALFWERVIPMFFEGEDSVVPFLPLHRLRKEESKLILLGRIFDHGFILTSEFPKKLALSSVLQIVKSNVTVKDDVVLKDFLQYLTIFERRLVNKALDSFEQLTDVEMDYLTDCFIAHGLNEVPKKNEIGDQVLTLATDVIINRPRNLLRSMSAGLHPENVKNYWNLLSEEEITARVLIQIPTRQKVVECLRPPQYMRPNEANVFYFLQVYLFGLERKELEQFLLFVSGSVHMPKEINITFTSSTGENIAPRSNTCSTTLRLSANYNSLSEFKLNMNNTLSSEYAYSYACQ